MKEKHRPSEENNQPSIEQNNKDHIFFIDCFYASDDVITNSMDILKQWSSELGVKLRLGWIKQSNHRFILTFTPHSDISQTDVANLYIRLSELDGFAFICTTFN